MTTALALSLLEWFVIILGIPMFIVIAHVVVSWLVNFQVLNLRQPLVGQIWYWLNQLTEPMYRPFRRMMPDLGGLDLAPMAVMLVIIGLRILAANMHQALLWG